MDFRVFFEAGLSAAGNPVKELEEMSAILEGILVAQLCFLDAGNFAGEQKKA